jgi:hypothetical protein
LAITIKIQKAPANSLAGTAAAYLLLEWKTFRGPILLVKTLGFFEIFFCGSRKVKFL